MSAARTVDARSTGPSARLDAPALPRIPFSDLRHVRKLGHGAFGEVEECLWHDAPVAVKANGMGPGDAAALEAEVRLYERLSGSQHPNVVAVMGVCVDAPDGKVRVVMRLCAKGSLEDLLAKARVEVSCALVGSRCVPVFIAMRTPAHAGVH